MKRVLWGVALAILVFWVVWGVTAREQGNMGWGNLVTVRDVASAKLFGLDKPGAYVGVKSGKALPAVRGGLKLIFTFEDWELGFRALGHRMFVGVDGAIFTATLSLWILALAALLVIRTRATRQA
jgi:hypothetical protein